MFDELKLFQNMTDNISEIQVINEQTFSKIRECLKKNENVKEHLENLQIQLQMQENLIRMCFEMDMIVEHKYDDDDDVDVDFDL